jgi:hypothetical protein
MCGWGPGVLVGALGQSLEPLCNVAHVIDGLALIRVLWLCAAGVHFVTFNVFLSTNTERVFQLSGAEAVGRVSSSG